MWGGTHLNQGPHKSSSHARGVLPISPLCWVKHWAFLCSPCRVSAFKFFIRPRYVKARHWRLARYFKIWNTKYEGMSRHVAGQQVILKCSTLSLLPPSTLVQTWHWCPSEKFFPIYHQKAALAGPLLFHQLAQFASSFAAIFQFSARSADSASRYFPIMLFSLPTWCHPSTFHFENKFWTKLVLCKDKFFIAQFMLLAYTLGQHKSLAFSR